MPRKRIHSILLVLLFIALGLFSRSSLFDFPEFVTEYLGDTIWAMMVYFIFTALFPKKDFLIIALYAITFSFLIEISQVYQADWIKSIRSIKIFGLILGYGFKWSDLLAYTIAVSIACILDYLLLKFRA